MELENYAKTKGEQTLVDIVKLRRVDYEIGKLREIVHVFSKRFLYDTFWKTRYRQHIMRKSTDLRQIGYRYRNMRQNSKQQITGNIVGLRKRAYQNRNLR